MPNDNKCPKCGSSERIPDVTVMAFSVAGEGEVMAEVESHPHALFFKGVMRGPLKATVCAECGFTELYATDARALLSAYRTRQSPGEGG